MQAAYSANLWYEGQFESDDSENRQGSPTNELNRACGFFVEEPSMRVFLEATLPQAGTRDSDQKK